MSELNRKLHDLFIEAIEKPPKEWAAFIDEKCDTPELRARLERLLNAHARSGEFLESTAIEVYSNLAFPFGGRIEEFRIIRLIGKGGAGHVYLAEDTVLKRLVALKIVDHSAASQGKGDEVVERFRREARAVARLSHPSVVQVYQTGEKEGLSYIAMEYVEGTTLREWMDSAEESEQSGTSQRIHLIAKLISQVADAMDCAHRAGVIHRDIKPSNILIDVDGNARLADFGIAQITTEETLQRTGVVMGSCAYMSPEQARVLDIKVDHRTDIFSLGIVLYEAISRQRPFEGATFSDVLRALTDCNPKPLTRVVPNISNDLAVICHKAIEKDVNDRYPSAAHFFADLKCFLNDQPILARPPTVYRRLRNWFKAHQRLAVYAIIACLLLALLGMNSLYYSVKRTQMGQLQVSEKHAGTRVRVSRLSDKLELENSIDIGVAPVSTYLSPGLYRVMLMGSEETLEATSLIEAGTVDILEVNAPSKEVVDKMVEISGGMYEIGDASTSVELTSKRSVEKAAFKISATEVSNREYREYVLAHKVAAPSSWPDPYDPAIDDLPVSGISWDEANLYCRWRGVRLPTPDEWEIASKGPGGSVFPWGSSRGDIIQREEIETLNQDVYRSLARPVDSDPQLATPLGIKHMLSNVQEYTEGIAVERSSGLIVKGRSWVDSPFVKPSAIFVLSDRDVVALNRGFRVALSINDER
jgi:serine/threonine protein kinase